MAEIQGLNAGGGLNRGFGSGEFMGGGNVQPFVTLQNQALATGGGVAALPAAEVGGKAAEDSPVKASRTLNDVTALEGDIDAEPLSPRNREYRMKMIEMNAAHKVSWFLFSTPAEVELQMGPATNHSVSVVVGGNHFQFLSLCLSIQAQ